MEQQIILFQKIKENLPSAYPLASELADLLSISVDAAYRRIRGESALTYDEYLIVGKKYKLTNDVLIDNAKSKKIVSFSYNSLYQNYKGFYNYISYLIKELEDISNAKHSNLIFTGTDIPIFHYFKYPSLTKFKLKYWLKSVLNIAEYENKNTEAEELLHILLKKAHFLYDYFQYIPSVEIWTDTTLNGFLKQIEYYFITHEFNVEETLEILKDASLMLDNIQQQAKMGKKQGLMPDKGSKFVNYDFYYSEVALSVNLVLVEKDKTNMSFVSYQGFNSMSTFDNIFYNENKVWIQGVIKSSALLSNTGEKLRSLFFKQQKDKIDALKLNLKL